MLKSFVLLPLCFGLAASNAFASAPSCSTAPDDKAQIVDTMKTFFAAAGSEDVAQFHTVVVPGFYAYDGGKRFDGDGLMDLIKQVHASGKVLVWSVNEPDVHITCNTAWIAYVNRGSMQDQSGKQDLTWLESAFLDKTNGTWRMEFLQSQRVPK